MTDQTLTARLAQYGASLITADGARAVEMAGEDGRVFQWRTAGGEIERRILRDDHTPMRDGSPWVALPPSEVAELVRSRGDFHPILDGLGA